MTGLSIDTLRAWERRYGAVTPGRDDRGRSYSSADVGRLKALASLVERGHAIGTVAKLSDRELGALLHGADQLTSHPPSRAVHADLEPLSLALDRYDLETMEAALNQFAAVLPPRELVSAVILPLLQRMGQRWESGELRPAQEHLVSAIVRTVLGGLLRATARPRVTPKVVFATPSGERHELGLLCAALLTASAGFGVVYLGPDLPAAEIAHAAARAEAAIVLVSLTTPGAVSKSELRALRDLPPGVSLWVGGPAAGALVDLVGEQAHRVDSIESVVALLKNYDR